MVRWIDGVDVHKYPGTSIEQLGWYCEVCDMPIRNYWWVHQFVGNVKLCLDCCERTTKLGGRRMPWDDGTSGPWPRDWEGAEIGEAEVI